MSISSQTNSIRKALEKYNTFLGTIDEESFQESPAEGSWSYSEVFSHIIQSNLGSLIAIERCVHGNKSHPGSLTLKAWFVLFFGWMPGRIKAPPRIAAMVQKINREDAGNGLVKLRTRLEEIAPLIKKSSKSNKIEHPRLGMLNAGQWLRFIEIHTLHHLKQIDRITTMLHQQKV